MLSQPDGVYPITLKLYTVVSLIIITPELVLVHVDKPNFLLHRYWCLSYDATFARRNKPAIILADDVECRPSFTRRQFPNGLSTREARRPATHQP
jgi:hypothetical protein